MQNKPETKTQEGAAPSKSTCESCKSCMKGECGDCCEMCSGKCSENKNAMKQEEKQELKREESVWFRSHGHVLSFWRWFFVIGLIGLVIGYAGGRAGGKHAAMREMMKNRPHDMKTMMSVMNEVLESKSGSELEQAFLEEMILHHEGAVNMAETIKAGTKRPELQKLANGIITAQNQEIGMMKVWLSQWFDINE